MANVAPPPPRRRANVSDFCHVLVSFICSFAYHQFPISCACVLNKLLLILADTLLARFCCALWILCGFYSEQLLDKHLWMSWFSPKIMTSICEFPECKLFRGLRPSPYCTNLCKPWSSCALHWYDNVVSESAVTVRALFCPFSTYNDRSYSNDPWLDNG